MSKWQRKPDTFIPFEANRYEDPINLVPGVHRGADGCAYVSTIQGREVEVSLGEWVIQEPDGAHYDSCSDEIFRQRYEPYDANQKPGRFR